MNTNTQHTTKYKNSPLGLIPEDWEVKRLGEICVNFRSGNGITSNDIYDNGEYPVYGGNGLRGYTRTYTHEGVYLLIGRQGALCGNIFYVDGKNYISEHAIAVKTNEDNDNKFLAYKLDYLNLNRFSESSAQPGLSVEKLVRHKLTLPLLPEQQAIADCLSTWDKSIEKLNALIAQKELSKKALMQQLLSGIKRLKGFNGEWIEIKLGDIGEFRTSSVDKVLVEGEKVVNLVNYMDVYRNQFITPDFHCSKTSVNERELISFELKKGDILFTPSSETPDDIGHSAVITEDIEDTVFSYHLMRFRLFDKNSLSFDFRAYVFNNQKILNEFSKRATGSTRYTLSKGDFQEAKAYIPKETEEQTAIANVLQCADDELQLLKKKLEQLKEQKKGLMQVLLTGKKRLKY